MNASNAREILCYTEQHTLMTQDVVLYTNEKECIQMLNEDITEVSKRELFQTYYVHRLDSEITIEPKNDYGNWNASIGDIKNTKKYLPEIINKLKGNISYQEIEKNICIVERIAGLSLNEKALSYFLREEMMSLFGVPKKTINIKI